VSKREREREREKERKREILELKGQCRGVEEEGHIQQQYRTSQLLQAIQPLINCPTKSKSKSKSKK
jgi:hypothetical protein